MVLRTHLGNHIERWPCRCFRARSTDRPREPLPGRPFDMRTSRDTSINSPPSCVRDRLSLRNKVWPDRPQWADRRGPHGEWGKNSQASSKFKRHRASKLISIDPFATNQATLKPTHERLLHAKAVRLHLLLLPIPNSCLSVSSLMQRYLVSTSCRAFRMKCCSAVVEMTFGR